MSTDIPVVHNISMYILHYSQFSSVNMSIQYVIEAYVFVYCISGAGRSSSTVTDVGCSDPGQDLGFSEVGRSRTISDLDRGSSAGQIQLYGQSNCSHEQK